ncbi:MAG TPA: lysophospholipid acyltransferase family protein [Candidatus Acidoferrum sp.]|nr:lysophospholipid acyltransferase family protein [Candidatus Acidoferrum sp.]
MPPMYRLGRWVLGAALGFYFTRIDQFHLERVPVRGPVLFAANHPNSLTDAFVIGSTVPRKVNFVATVQMFRIQPIRWLLNRCGVIAINRVQDDPHAMRDVQKTFEACFRVLEKGEAVGIFPEGKCGDEPQLKTVKTGAARMALELEGRHAGKLGLKIVPVGLTFSAKATYRSGALVNFGEPIRVADFLAEYSTNRHGCIQALTAELESRLKSLTLHLPHLERARIVEAVKRLYLDRLLVGNTVIQEPATPISGELLLTQAIARAVDFTFETHPARAAEFVRRLGHYEAAMRKLHLSDEVLRHFPERRWLLRQSLAWTGVALLGAPVAAYGWLHRLVPYALVRVVVGRVAKQRPDKTQISTAAILSGLVAFTGFYALCVFIFHRFFGLRATVLYACSLPPASLIAHYYVRELRRFAASLRAAVVLLRAPSAARKLLTWRAELIELIGAERQEFRAAQAAPKEA